MRSIVGVSERATALWSGFGLSPHPSSMISVAKRLDFIRLGQFRNIGYAMNRPA